MCFSKLSKSICLISQNLEKGSGGSDKIERNADKMQRRVRRHIGEIW